MSFDILSALPHLNKTYSEDSFEPPSDEECFALWKKYEMLENVQKHSLLVAKIATLLATRACNAGIFVNVDSVRASALLHDIAKTYCLLYGGNHATLGASWTAYETKNFSIAQGVMLHVHWPWMLPAGKAICILPIFVLYADKRVKHDECVTLTERFNDLLLRYGKTAEAQRNIMASHEQAIEIEKRLSRQLECNLNEDTFDCGRLV